MKRSLLVVGVFIAALVSSNLTFAAQSEPANTRQPLDVYSSPVTPAQIMRLQTAGHDLGESLRASRSQVELVLTQGEADKLNRQGFQFTLKRSNGKTAQQLAGEQARAGYQVWRPYDGPGGFRDQMYRIARENPQYVKLSVIGHTTQNREILALKVTQGARELRDGARPAVLYLSLQHAREWIAGEVNRRLLRYIVGNIKSQTVKDFLKDRELWFVLVANPDGYQYTFTDERLWRKNLRDNDGDGLITFADGVDLNRNFPEHWGNDNEGSSPAINDETYRGPAAASEPETQALIRLMGRVPFKYLVNYHSAAELLLYDLGWQIQTPSADRPIFEVLSGDDARPAIEGFDPDPADELYITNGDTGDYAYSVKGILSWTPELTPGEGTPSGFIFPDDEELVQAEFEKNIPFAADVARSVVNPAKPVSHLGNTVQPFYVDAFDVSYGDPQTVQVNAARSLGEITLKYRINGGAVKSAQTSEWKGGERYGDGGDVYYHRMRGTISGANKNDTVEVWFTGGGKASRPFRYTVKNKTRNKVLVLAAENYTAGEPEQPDRLQYLDTYLNALKANNVAADVYNVDAMGNQPPDPLGVLSHYRAVIWYTGEDILTLVPGQPDGSGSSRLANDEMLAVRDFLNEGGKLLYAGKYAGLQYAFGFPYNQGGEPPYCDVAPPPEEPDCLFLSDDFLQYYLGAYYYNDDAGTTDDGDLFDVIGVAPPFRGSNWSFAPPNQYGAHSASFTTTSGVLPVEQFPQFASAAAAKYVRPGGPYEPHSGQYFLYSQISDASYKRATTTIDLSSSTASELSFWISHDTELAYDYVFVEAHTAGEDDWTTLPDLNGNTSTDTGDSCLLEWASTLHPQLLYYQTYDPATGTCAPQGTTGEWNAANGNSDGWQNWRIDLSQFAGEEVEVSISYASDWYIQGLGVFIDDVRITADGSVISENSFETGLGDWTVPGPPPGSTPQTNDFTRATTDDVPEGAVVSTPDTLFFGFGLEQVDSASQRAAIMRRALEYLLE